MRAIPSPPAIPVAAAALALVAAALASMAVPSTAMAERWLRPVSGEVARAFSYERAAPFRAGAHRGADLAAPPGTAVAAACGGRVRHAGRVAGSEGVVSVSCGGRRVSYLPLAAIAVEAGELVRAGATIGRVAGGHRGLHLGVRREDDPFGYEDPAALLPAPQRPLVPPPVPAPRSPRPPAPRLAPRASLPRLAPRPSTPRLALRPSTPRLAPRRWQEHPSAPRRAPAPWPVWAGLATLLAGAAGSGTVALRRRSRARAAVSVTAPA